MGCTFDRSGATPGDLDASGDGGDQGVDGASDAPGPDIPLPTPTAGVVFALPASALVVDGNLSEWSEDHWIELAAPADYVIRIESPTGPADIGARLALRWSAAALYLAVEVTDEVHYNMESPSTLRDADSVVLTLDVGRDSGDGLDAENDFSYGWGLLDGQPGRYRLHAPPGSPAAANQYALARAPGKTTYEIALPASDLGLDAIEGGLEMGINVVVPDHDGHLDRDGYLRLSPSDVADYDALRIWP